MELRSRHLPLKNGCFLLHQGRNILGELTTWRSSQHPGLQTYKAFRNKTLQLSTSDAEHRALYALLAAMAADTSNPSMKNLCPSIQRIAHTKNFLESYQKRKDRHLPLLLSRFKF